jgi:cobalt-zinc-cadmium efflux system protein
LRGAFWHVMQTFIGSILVLITAAVIYFTGFLAIDPILGMAFGLVLLAASWGIIRDALSILMEGAPKSIDLAEVAAALGELPDSRNIHHMHAWTLTSGKNVFSAHIGTDKPDNAGTLLAQAHPLLRERFGFYFSTLQIETVCLDEDHVQELDIASVLRRPLPD